ncbi:MAG: HDOD domain-containing protein, partial [Planctomycetota bacterium]|nr:HDOD domain-containing protein [Planctomycetota bacterium]
MATPKPSQPDNRDFRAIWEKFAVKREMPEKSLLLPEGKSGQPAVFLRAGKAHIQYVHQKRAITIAHANAGEWLGDPPSDQGQASRWRAIAATACEILLLDAKAWRALPAEARCQAAEDMAAAQSRRLAAAAALADELGRQKQCLARQMARAVEERRRAVRDCRLLMDHLRGLPSLPVFVHKILAALQDEESSAKEVAAIAQEDPSLVAQILKTVNSAQYGLPKRVDDFQRAVALLGSDEVRRIVLAIGLE